MFSTCPRLVFILLIPVLLNGCVAAAITGTAAGAAMAVDKRTTGTMIEDQAIEFRARSALDELEELRQNGHINITSYNTVVLLTGEVPTEGLRQQAVETVRDVDKVSHVYDEITIAAPSSLMSRSSDSVITSKVKTKLLAAEDVSGINIKVVTNKGVVYLMGLINRSQADRATEIARTTGGVQKVVRLFQYKN